MDLFDIAMQIEKEGEGLYRELAQKTSNKGLSCILNWLADEEVKHYEILQTLKREEKATFIVSTLLEDSKNIFAGMRDKTNNFNFEISQQSLYKKALGIEKKSVVFYTEKAEECTNQIIKDALLKIAGEEEKHYVLIENIIELISRPETWLENAEFNKIGEEY